MPRDEIVITPSRGIEQSFVERVRDTWPLVITWTMRDVRVRYRQSVLRSAWSLVQPVTILVTYGFILTRVLDIRTDEAPYLTFAWAGIVPITFFSQSLGLGVGSIQQSGSIISRLYFPREVLPLSVVGGAFIDLMIMTSTLVVAAWFQVGRPSPYLLGLVPVYATLIVWTTAATVLASAVTVFRRDLNFAVPLILRVLFIITPVMYPADLIAEAAPWLITANPLAVVVEGTRDAVFRDVWPDMSLLSVHFAAGLIFLVLTFLVFRRLEPRMSDHV